MKLFYSVYIASSTIVTSCGLCVCAAEDSRDEQSRGKEGDAVSEEEDAWAADQDLNPTGRDERIQVACCRLLKVCMAGMLF